MRRLATFHCVIASIAFFVVACDRSSPGVNDADIAINGYRIEGTVRDGFLRPLGGMEVRLYYTLVLESTDSVSRVYQPQTPGEFIVVEVKDAAGGLVNTLFAGQANDSDLFVIWNQLDSLGNPVRSGLYTISYSVGSVIRMSYRQIVDGNPNAGTDSNGRFVIPESDLPIGEIAPYFDAVGVFLGQYEISDEVFLQFVDPSFSRTYRVPLTKDKTTNFSPVLN